MAAVALALALTGAPALALAPGSMVSWNSGTAEGWVLNDVINPTSVQPLLVSGNAATIQFNAATGMTMPEGRMVKGTVAASSGAFVGDYWNGGVASIAFRLLVETESPRTMSVVLHSAVGDQLWSRTVALPAAGQWVNVEVPMQYSAGWRQGLGDTEESFVAALQAVDWIGVAAIRSGAIVGLHNIKVDDLQITGVPATVTLSGIVSYRGDQVGTVRVLATESKYGWGLQRSSVPGAGGVYAIGQVPSLRDYWVKAFLDSNSNGTHDFWEAFGWYNNESKLSRVLGDMAGLNVALADPSTAEGMPYWWLRQYFGITAPEGTAGAAVPGSDVDSDGDTASNLAEYKAGTDPTDFASRFTVGTAQDDVGTTVRWNTKPGAVYNVWRSSQVASGYLKVNANPIAGGEYIDTDAAGEGPFFYRVEVQ